jgi:hypothetical protein
MNDTQFLIYRSAQGNPEIIVRLEEETVWLTQQQMADLFATTKPSTSLFMRRTSLMKANLIPLQLSRNT